jgi:hypothetical protein
MITTIIPHQQNSLKINQQNQQLRNQQLSKNAEFSFFFPHQQKNAAEHNTPAGQKNNSESSKSTTQNFPSSSSISQNFNIIKIIKP